jgi:hypothetical protein
MSVPGSKIILIAERSGTDFERMMSSPGTPARACSSGTVTRPSTSTGESPMEIVWISTRGGANSGKTSTGMRRSCPMPKYIIPMAIATTRKRNFRLVATMKRSIADPARSD